VYGSKEPANTATCFIKTKIQKKRLKQHIKNSFYKKTHKDYWIQEVLSREGEIKLKILEETDKENWQKKERYWIKKIGEKSNLTNHSKGGRGGRELKYTINFEEMREWSLKNVKAQSSNEWYKKIKTMEFPENITKYPKSSYKNRGWKGWGHFLNTNKRQDNIVNYLTYDEAKKYIKENYDIKSVSEWMALENRSNFIPKRAYRYYSKKNRGWVSWGDFLGNNNLPNHLKKFVNYFEFKKWIDNKSIKSSCQFRKIKKPKDIPSNPDKYYSEWIGWNDIFN